MLRFHLVSTIQHSCASSTDLIGLEATGEGMHVEVSVVGGNSIFGNELLVLDKCAIFNVEYR